MLKHVMMTMYESRHKNQPKLVFAHVAHQQSEPPRAVNGAKSTTSVTSTTTAKSVAARYPQEDAKIQQQSSMQPSTHLVMQHYHKQQQQQHQMQQQHEQKQQKAALQQQQSLQHQHSPVLQELRQKQNNQQQPQQQQQQQHLQQKPQVQKPQQQLQHQQQQNQPPSQQLQKNIGNVTMISKQTQPSNSTAPINGYLKTPIAQAAERPSNGALPNKAQPHTILDNNNNNNNNKNNTDIFEGFNIYRGRVHEIKKGKGVLFENTGKSSSMSTHVPSPGIVKKTSTSSPAAAHKTSVQHQGNDASLRYSAANDPTKQRPLQHVPPPQQQQQLYLPQQYQHHQQNQLDEVVLRDHHRQIQDGRSHASATRVHSYPQSRQQTLPNYAAATPKTAQSSGTWTIPRIAASAGSRPQSQPLSSSTRSTETTSQNYLQPGGDAPRHTSPRASPNASPRTVSRSSYRLDPDMTSRQQSSSPPKSILKNNLALEQSDLYLSSRPFVLPRAQGEKNPTYAQRDFDFSTILTSSTLTKKPPTIQVKGQVQTLPSTSATSSPLNSKRPVTAGAALTKYELNQDGQPPKKSVTFNKQVRLHLDNQVSTVKSLSVDA